MNTRIETLAEIIRDEASNRLSPGEETYIYYKSILYHAHEILIRLQEYRIDHPELY